MAIKKLNPKKIKEIKKEENVKKAVEEWKRAKAVKASQEEYQKEITGKMRERIHWQKEFEEIWLRKNLQETKLSDMRERIKSAEKFIEKEVNWLGFEYSIDHIKSAYNLELYNLRTLLQNFANRRDRLKNVGFKEKQLIDVLKGIYIRDHKTLAKMEQKHEKKKSKKKNRKV